MHAGAYYEERLYISGGFTSLHPASLGADSWYRDDRMPSVCPSAPSFFLIVLMIVCHLCVCILGGFQTHSSLPELQAQFPLHLRRGRNGVRVPRVRPHTLQGAPAVDPRVLNNRCWYVCFILVIRIE